MTPSINLIVPLRDPGNALPKFVTCLDSQLLSTDEWAVTFVDGGSTDLTPGRLASLSRYRPHVEVVTLPNTASWWDLIRSGVEAATGTWVMVCDVADVLTKAALQRLQSMVTEQTGLDFIAARSVDHARTAADESIFVGPGMDQLNPTQALLTPAGLYRRGFVDLGPLSGDLAGPLPSAQLAHRLSTSNPAIGLLPGYPVLVGAGVRRRASTTDRVHDVLDALNQAGGEPGELASVLAREVGRMGAGLVGLHRLGEVQRWAGRLHEGLGDGPERCLLKLLADEQFDLAAGLAALLASPKLEVAPADVSWKDGRVRVEANGHINLDAGGVLRKLREGGIQPEQLYVPACARLGLRNRLTTSIYR